MDGDEEKPKHPITGEPFDEEAERAKLIPLGSKEELVTPDMQRVFIEDYLPKVTHGLNTLRIVKNKLFYSGESDFRHGDLVNYIRCYAIPKRDNFSDLAILEIYKKEELQELSLLLLGEQIDIEYPDKDRFRVEFDPDGAAESLSVSGVINRERLHVTYDQSGNLTDLYINSATHEHEDPDFTLYLDEITTKLDEIKKSGKSYINARGSVYEFGFDEESNSLTIERIEDEKLKDSISIPLEQNIAGAINTLVSKNILDDPVQADLKYDESWKNASFETFGIKWHRK